MSKSAMAGAAILALMEVHRACVIDECKDAVRRRMVAQEWPPQDGDQQIDEVLEALDALRSSEREGAHRDA